jgi:hypothetical protein
MENSILVSQFIFPASSDHPVHSCQYIWRIVKPICFAFFRLITIQARE